MKEGVTNRFVRWMIGRRFKAADHPPKKVAVIVPLPSLPLKEDEKISFEQLQKHLRGYDRFLLVPEGMSGTLPEFRRIELDRRFFGSAARHNRLLFTLGFWNLFREYEYVLMYHLDALVFRDELKEWCESGIDFIGAPWVRSAQTPWVEEERCGNGGFALYRIPAVIRVLTNRKVAKPSRLFIDRFAEELEELRKILAAKRDEPDSFLKSMLGDRLDLWIHKLEYVEVNKRPNDYFWALDAILYDPSFKVGSLEQGLRFAFEVDPAACLERNAGKLPFGAHAWERYDRSFWSSHLFGDGDGNGDPSAI